MTMKALRTLSAVGLAAGMVATASAVPTPDATGIIVVRTSGYYDTSYGGGEFTLKGSPWANTAHYASATLVARGFQTFCLERNEFLSGQPFDGWLNTAAVNGGLGGGSPDPISIGTAWLYKQFAEGNLAGYDYTPGAGREASARALQEAIWMLEDEMLVNPLNPYISLVITQFGSLASAKADYTSVGPNYTVRAINLYSADGTKRQDMLVYLPDGGMTLILMGGGLLGLALIRRKE
jgi:hypothetical protein